MKAFFQYMEYDQVGAGKYGSGGWSNNAKRKPQRHLVEGVCELNTEAILRKMNINGVDKLKFNLLAANGQKREDWPDVVPSWWHDKLAVAIKFSELKP